MRLETTPAPIKGRPAIRRCVRRTEILADGKQTFVTKSFTKDDGTVYHPVIDPETGEFSCTCPDHLFRHGKRCKHIARALVNVFRSSGIMMASELPVLAIPATDAEYRDYYASLSDSALEGMAPPAEVR